MGQVVEVADGGLYPKRDRRLPVSTVDTVPARPDELHGITAEWADTHGVIA